MLQLGTGGLRSNVLQSLAGLGVGRLTVLEHDVVESLPNRTHRSLAGTWHGLSDEALASVLTEFFKD